MEQRNLMTKTVENLYIVSLARQAEIAAKELNDYMTAMVGHFESFDTIKALSDPVKAAASLGEENLALLLAVARRTRKRPRTQRRWGFCK